MIPRTSLRRALADPNLLGGTLTGDSWRAWRVLLIAAMGEELQEDERALFKELTGRVREPGQRVEEFAGVVGRRGGKSRAISVLATYIAGLCDHPALVRGETGVVLIIAPDARQATICLDYIEATFRASPILRKLIENRIADTLELTNGVSVEVRAANFRRLRGPTYLAVIADECAFWFSDEHAANVDAEILGACRPGLATTSGPLIMISSPYARRGELHRVYAKHFGPRGDPLVLVAQAASRTMNQTLPQSVIDRAMERDPAHANAEYLAQFRTDIESFVSIEAVQACVARGIYERAPRPGQSYAAFTDPSGGSADSFTLGIGHHEPAAQITVLDALREVKPPFSPEDVCREFSALLKTYSIARVSGDRYAGAWPVELFSKFGIAYEQSAAPKSDLYRDMLPLINSRRLDLLDHPKLVSQLTSLERRTARSGKDSIDHPPGGHDDIVNSVAGIAALFMAQSSFDSTYRWLDGDETNDDPDGRKAWDRLRLHEYLRAHGIPYV